MALSKNIMTPPIRKNPPVQTHQSTISGAPQRKAQMYTHPQSRKQHRSLHNHKVSQSPFRSRKSLPIAPGANPVEFVDLKPFMKRGTGWVTDFANLITTW